MNTICINKYKKAHSPVSKEIFINGQAEVAIARRVTLHIAKHAGFSQRRCAQASIIVSEIGTNLVKHTKGGLLKINLSFLNHIPFLTIAGLDKGPGIASIKRAMLDGVSGINSLGTGLGAVYRLSNKVAICSKEDIERPCPYVFDDENFWNTVLVCQLWDERNPLPLVSDRIDFSCLLEAMEGNSICGDAVHVASTPFYTRFILMDGLGRGNGAAEAVCRAIKVLDGIPSEMQLEYVVDILESPLSNTQGAALLMLRVDLKYKKLQIYGTGSVKLILGLDSHLYYFLHFSDFLNFKTPIDISSYRSLFAVIYTDGVGNLPLFNSHDVSKDISSLIWNQLLFRHRNIKDDASMLVIKWKI